MAGQTVTVSVLADTKRFSAGMRKVSQDTGLDKLGRAAKKAALGAAVGIGAVVAAAAVWGKNSVDALKRIETIGARTDAVLASTRNAAGRTRKQIDGLAGSIEDMTGVEAESITEGQNLLLTYTSIKGVNFDRTTQAMTDMAVALNKGKVTGLDMSSAANMLGKALNDPAKGLAKLSRVGVQFTAEQEAQIKAMAAAGDTAGAQALMLEELERQFGGSAAAAGNTVEGMSARIGNAFGNIGEELFGFLMPILMKVAGWVLTSGLPAFKVFASSVKDRVAPVLTRLGAWFSSEGLPRLKAFAAWVRSEVVPRLAQLAAVVRSEVLPRVQALAGWITGTLVPGIASLVSWVVKNKDWLTALAVTIGVAVAVWRTYVVAMGIWRAATLAAAAVAAAFNAVMAANPIGLIVLAIAALVAGLVYFFTKTETGKKLWASFTSALSRGWQTIKAAFVAGYNAVKSWLGKVWAFIKLVWGFTPYGLILNNWRKIIAAFVAGYNAVKSWLGKALAFIKSVWRYSPLGLVTSNFGKIVAFFKGLPQKLKDGLGSIKDKLTAPFRAAFNAIARLWNNTLGKVSFTLPDWLKYAPGVGDLAGKTFGFPKIPMLAKGGIVTGPTLALVGEGSESEAVLPLSKLEALLDLAPRRGGDVNIVVNVTAGVGDPVEIGRQVAAALKAYNRANGVRA